MKSLPRAFLTAAWHDLAIFSYEVDPALLSPLVPLGTELDTWNAAAYVSLVAFRFLDTRLLGIPIPFHRNFPEVNLRFYVRRSAGGEWRRAVVFVREIVPRRVVALVARVVYDEPYMALPMRSEVKTDPHLAVAYSWRLGGAWHTLDAQTDRPGAQPLEGSLEHFITEHYWGYTRRRDSSTLEYHVAHPPWTVAPARTHRVDADLAAVYGRDLASFLDKPSSVIVADGSPVTVSHPTLAGSSRPAAA